MRKSTILAALMVAFTVVACSGEDPADVGGSPPAATEPCDSPVETAKITIADLAFQPDCFTLPPGTVTLAVENTDDTDHTFTIAEIELNEDIGPGETVGVDVGEINDGTWQFRCSIHPQMTGFLVLH